MNAYCDRQSVDFNSIAFLFDGRRLRAEQTPDEVTSLSVPHSLLLFSVFQSCMISLTENLQFYSLKWKMEMRSMQCFIRLVVVLKMA